MGVSLSAFVFVFLMNADPLPKIFVRAYFPAEDKTAYLNRKTQVAQWDHPGPKGESAANRTSPFPLERPVKDVPLLFQTVFSKLFAFYRIVPQPANMPSDWEQCISVIPSRTMVWDDPHIVYRNLVDHAIQEADPRPENSEDILPEGWRKQLDHDGDFQKFYGRSCQLNYVFKVNKQNVRRRKSVFQANTVSEKTWVIGPPDIKAFDAIDNYLTPVEDIPEAVRNKKHNRYMDILPNPRTAVKLSMLDNDPSTTYINANYVRGPLGEPRFYVAAMGPMETTVVNFWRLLWESRTAAIIMATGIVEKGRKKCERYWPAEVDGKTSMTFGNISITALKEAKARGYTFTLLRAQCGKTVRKIGHFWYNTWPDHGVPKSASNTLYPDSVLGMLHTVHKWCTKASDRPILVHCSAGVGRTGAIIAVDHCRHRLKTQGRVDPLQIIDMIRQDRCALVQHPIQFKFVHAACTKYAEMHKHAFIVEEVQVADESSDEESLPDNTQLLEDKRAAQTRKASIQLRRRRSIMTKSQMHGELRLNARHTPKTKTTDEDIETLWQIFDLDGDGSISLEEARLQGIDAETFGKMDTDGNGVISLEEFRTYYQRLDD
eukprot:gene10372-2505_t